MTSRFNPAATCSGLSTRHAGHGRAVRVGDDALGDVRERVGVDLGHDERDIGIHPPCATSCRSTITPTLVNRSASAFEPVAPAENERDVETRRVGDRRILDRDLHAVPRQRAPDGPSRSEVADLVDRELSLGEHRSHDAADLPGCSYDAYTHGRQATGGPCAESCGFSPPGRTRRATPAPNARRRRQRPRTRSGSTRSRSSRC